MAIVNTLKINFDKKAKSKIINQIELLGFTVEPSNVAHYTQYAWR